jgi:hypothetical protein
MSKRRLSDEEVVRAVKDNPPKTQYECCLLGARLSVGAGNIPKSDTDFIDAAHAMATGLFGPAFANADYAQKSAWIDMCERAFRAVLGKEI